jgi:hypothetical protein
MTLAPKTIQHQMSNGSQHLRNTNREPSTPEDLKKVMTTEERSHSAVLSLSPMEATIGYMSLGYPHLMYIGPSLATGLNTTRVEA